MEKIQSHEIKDIWRVRDGLLVEIYKYKSLGCHNYSKKKEKIVRGCKGLRILTEDFTSGYEKKAYPKGTYFYNGQPVEPVSDVSLFRAEIKSSGGSIFGTIGEIENVLKDIQSILDEYK